MIKLLRDQDTCTLVKKDSYFRNIMLQSLVVKISALIVKKQIGCKSDQYKKDQLSQINTYLPDICSDIKKKNLKLKKLYYIIKKQTIRMFFKKGCTLETQGIVWFGFFEALRSGTIGIKLQIMKNAQTWSVVLHSNFVIF